MNLYSKCDVKLRFIAILVIYKFIPIHIIKYIY